MRTLAVDLGARRVGLALSDEGGQLASPYDVLTISSPEQALTEVAAVVQREGVQRLVVGLPLNMDGSVGPQARQAIAWADRLGHATACPVVLIDERLSSFVAEQELTERRRAGEKLTRKRKKQQRDALAAADFLQGFLEGRLTPISPPI